MSITREYEETARPLKQVTAASAYTRSMVAIASVERTGNGVVITHGTRGIDPFLYGTTLSPEDAIEFGEAIITMAKQQQERS